MEEEKKTKRTSETVSVTRCLVGRSRFGLMETDPSYQALNLGMTFAAEPEVFACEFDQGCVVGFVETVCTLISSAELSVCFSRIPHCDL